MGEYKNTKEIERRREQEEKETRRVIRILCVIFGVIAFLLVDFVFFLIILNRSFQEGKFPEA